MRHAARCVMAALVYHLDSDCVICETKHVRAVSPVCLPHCYSVSDMGELFERGTQMEDDNKLSFFFLGLGLGVAVGVLFAPKSGSETREFLRSKADEGTDFVKRRAE